MSALALSLAVALAAKCAPGVAPETLLSVAKAESGLDALAIHDNTTGKAFIATDAVDAAQQAASLISKGHSVDMGIMQVNSTNLRALHLTIVGAFDACTSMTAGATILRQAYAGGETVDEQQHALRVALSRYNTGAADRGFANGYVARVERVSEQVVPAIIAGGYSAQPLPAPKPQAPAAPPETPWDGWDNDDSQMPAQAPPAAQIPTGDQKAAPAGSPIGLSKRIT